MCDSERPHERLRTSSDGNELTSRGNAQDASPSTTALLMQVAQGDSDAFGELYDLLATDIFRAMLHVTQNPSEAEDITHDVFIRVWRRAPDFDPAKGDARDWVASFAHQLSPLVSRHSGVSRRHRG